MKRSLALTLIVLFTLNTFAQAQKRHASAKPAQARAYCQGDKLPAGYVIGSLRQSEKCEGRPELEIRKPAAGVDVVCDGSPVPAGYSVSGVTGIAACQGANPLTNAMTIVSDGSAPPPAPKRAARPADDDDEDAADAPTGSANRPKTTQEIVRERADAINREAELDNAVGEHKVLIGMSKEQVLKSWGEPYDIDRTKSSVSGYQESWYYRKGGGTARVRLVFTDGKLSYFYAEY